MKMEAVSQGKYSFIFRSAMPASPSIGCYAPMPKLQRSKAGQSGYVAMPLNAGMKG